MAPKKLNIEIGAQFSDGLSTGNRWWRVFEGRAKAAKAEA